MLEHTADDVIDPVGMAMLDSPMSALGADLDPQAATSVSDDGGVEGSSLTLTLEATGGGKLFYSYTHFGIPDRFIIRYEGKTLLDTGFVSGSRSGTINLPAGSSKTVDIRMATNDSGTAWNYSVTAVTDDLPDISPFTLSGPTFKPVPNADPKMATGTGAVTLGREDGLGSLIIASGSASTQFTAEKISVTGGTFSAGVGGVSQSLWVGGYELDVATRKATITETASGAYKLSGLDVDFKEMTVLSDRVAFGFSFKLPTEVSGQVINSALGVGVGQFLTFSSAGVTLGESGKFLIPNASFKVAGGFEASGKLMSIEKLPTEQGIRFQGKFELAKSFTKLVPHEVVNGVANRKASTDPNTALKLELDLAGDNYVRINGPNKENLEVVGAFKVASDLRTATGFGISEAEVTFNTVTNEYSGAATFIVPGGGRFGKFGDGIGIRPKLNFFLDNGDLQLDGAGLTVTNVNFLVIPSLQIYFQGFDLRFKGYAASNPADLSVGGAVFGSIGPQFGAGGGTALAKFGGDVEFGAGAAKLTGTLDLLNAAYAGIGAITLVKGKGEVIFDFTKSYTQFSGDLNVLDGAATLNLKLRITGNGDFGFTAPVAVGVPNFISDGIFKSIAGRQLGNGNIAVQNTSNGDGADDFAAFWGTIANPFGGGTITVGYRLNGDGTRGFVGADSIPVVSVISSLGGAQASPEAAPSPASFTVAAGKAYALVGATWTTADGTVQLVVTLPDGTVVTEANFAANGIAIVPELTTNLQRFAVINNPAAGLYKAQVDDATGLGAVDITAYAEGARPTFDFLPGSPVQVGDTVTIAYTANDPDSVATINFYYSPTSGASDGVYIGTAKEAGGAGTFIWTPKGVATGTYFIYAVVNDGNSPIVSKTTTGTVTFGAAQEVDLASRITVNGGTVLPGDVMSYTFDVANVSGALARGARVVVDLPANGVFVSSSLTPVSVSGTSYTFNLGDLAGGATGSVTVDVRVAASLAGSTATTAGSFFSISGVARSDSYDSKPGNDAASLGLIIQEANAFVDLKLAVKNFPIGDLQVGQTITYEVEVTNAGTQTATGVVLREFFDNAKAVRFNSGGGTDAAVATFSIGSLAAGATRTVTVSATVTAAGPILNTSRVTSTQIDIAPIDNESVRTLNVAATAIPPNDLSLTMTSAGQNPDGSTRLVVTMNNAGPNIGSNIQVTVALPAGVTVVGSSVTQGSFNAATGVWTIGNVRENLSRTLTINVTGSGATGEVEIAAEITRADEPDADSIVNNGVRTEDDFAFVLLDFGGGLPLVPPVGPPTPPLPPQPEPPTPGPSTTPTPGPDVLTGTGGPDTFDALAGDDRISGLGGNDQLNGGEGTDVIFGGEGDDFADGGATGDYLSGDAGNDVMFGGAGVDYLTGGDGNDVLGGNGSGDRLNGGAGADRFLFFPGDALPGEVDVIEDFTSGVDRIDVSLIDANSLIVGDQAFSYRGFSAVATGAGTLHVGFVQGVGIFLFGYTDADANPDVIINIGTFNVTGADLVL